jgi:hypothetical protein
LVKYRDNYLEEILVFSLFGFFLFWIILTQKTRIVNYWNFKGIPIREYRLGMDEKFSLKYFFI